jgi:hypothetical protein
LHLCATAGRFRLAQLLARCYGASFGRNEALALVGSGSQQTVEHGRGRHRTLLDIGQFTAQARLIEREVGGTRRNAFEISIEIAGSCLVNRPTNVRASPSFLSDTDGGKAIVPSPSQFIAPTDQLKPAHAPIGRTVALGQPFHLGAQSVDLAHQLRYQGICRGDVALQPLSLAALPIELAKQLFRAALRDSLLLLCAAPILAGRL